MHREPTIEAFLASLAQDDGYHPLSDAKLGVLDDPDRCIVIVEGDQIVAIGVSAPHLQDDGTTRFAVETAVERSMRFPQFEKVVLDSAMEQVSAKTDVSVWSDRPSLDRVLRSRDFRIVRTLAFMVGSLPIRDLNPRDDLDVRVFQPEDAPDLVDVNRRSFAGHREAAALTEDDLESLASEPWFESDGIFLIEDGAGTIAYCWTKVHANGDGEIYRIGVVPERAGSGAGRLALSAGFEYLESRDDVVRGVLWVDTSNERAVALYSAAGMQIERSICEFEVG